MLQLDGCPSSNSRGSALKTVAKYIHSLGGHIHGEYIIHALLQEHPKRVETIECTLPIASLVYVPSVLSSGGFVITDADVADHISCRRIMIHDTCYIEMAPFFRSRDEAKPHHLTFDWSMISMSRDRMCVKRPFPSELKYVGDILSTLLHRIKNSKFCVAPLGITDEEQNTDDQGKSRVAKLDADAMRRSVKLVEYGWIMDDWLDGSNGWIVSMWKNISNSRRNSSGLRSHSSCPLCYERFCEDDIVVNLPCNHNFHVNCHVASSSQDSPGGTQASGLYAWLSSGHNTCPCCRASIRMTEKYSRT